MKKLNFRKKPKKEKLEPRITNDNLSEHREEVISSARKYKYPLRQSKHRLVVISLTIFFLAVISFFTYSVLALYKFKSETAFIYQITKIIPFPLARIGSDFVSYESYLFEINWYKHYYESQQNVDFGSDSGKVQLADYRKRASQKVINDGYVKKLAEERKISVTAKEIDQEVEIYKSQNRLGANDDQLKTVLSDYYGWSIDDFRATLGQKLLTQKVVADLDTETKQKAEDVLAQLEAGKDFSELAKKVSEDPSTSKNGGEIPGLVDKDNIDISPSTVNALFSLKPGEISSVINVGYGLEIVKNLEDVNGKVRAAHIIFNFKNINDYLGEVKDRVNTRTYITF
jgi:hypothetical protein